MSDAPTRPLPIDSTSCIFDVLVVLDGLFGTENRDMMLAIEKKLSL